MARLSNLMKDEKVEILFLMGIRGITLISKFILSLYMARYMGFADVGIYGLIIAATFIIPAFFGLGIMFVKTRQAVTQTPEQIVETLCFYIKFIFVLYVALFLIVGIGGIAFDKFLFFTLIMAVVMFEHVNNDFYYLALNLSRPIAANILHFIRASLWIFVFIAFSYYNSDFMTVNFLLICWIIGGLISTLGFIYAYKNWPWGSFKNNLSLVSWVKQEFPQARHIYKNNILDSISQYLNQYLISFILGLELTGIYVFFMQIVNAMSNLLRIGIIQSARPKLVRAYQEATPDFKSIYESCMKNTLGIAVAMAIIAAPAMYFLIHYVVDRPLALEWYPVYLISLFVFLFMMVIEVNNLVIYSHHRDDIALKFNAIYIFSLFVLTMLTIPFISLWGAIFTLATASLIKIYMQQKYLKENI